MRLSPSFWLVCGTLLLWATVSVFSAESVQLIGLESHIQPASQLPAVFGNREERINIEISGVAVKSASLRADLFQIAGALAMPLAKDIHLQEGLTFPNTSPKRLSISVKFPSVKQRAEVLVRLALVQSGPQANPILLESLKFEVFPDSVTKELKNLLQPKPDGSVQVVVFGPGDKFRRFLASLRLPFENAGNGTPDRFDPNRLYFGELATDEQFQQAQDRSAGACLALFWPDESLPVGVYADHSNSRVLVHVTSHVLDNMNNDPRAQLGLIKIIHLLSGQIPPAHRAVNL
ncbi:MAG: hypothetical protein PHD76_06600 [Methylacidiphilales bacterium]|nr:hypothetical protein [Candidatus Methylacidiphilales bacterium]